MYAWARKVQMPSCCHTQLATALASHTCMDTAAGCPVHNLDTYSTGVQTSQHDVVWFQIPMSYAAVNIF